MKKQTIILLWISLLGTIALIILFVALSIKLVKENVRMTCCKNKTEIMIDECKE